MKDKKVLIIEINSKNKDIKILKNKECFNQKNNKVEETYKDFYKEKQHNKKNKNNNTY